MQTKPSGMVSQMSKMGSQKSKMGSQMGTFMLHNLQESVNSPVDVSISPLGSPTRSPGRGRLGRISPDHSATHKLASTDFGLPKIEEDAFE